MDTDTISSISKSSIGFDYLKKKNKLQRDSTYSIGSTVTSSFLETSEFSSLNQFDDYIIDTTRKINFNSKDFKKKIYKYILDEDIDSLKNFGSNNQIESIRDKHKNSLLHIACGLGRLNSVKVLVKFFPKLLEIVNDKHQKPIDVAIKHNQVKIIELIFQKSNIYDDLYDVKKRPLIHNAAKNGSNEVLRLLLSEMNKRQLCLDIKDSNSNTAAHLAAKYGHLECLQTLIEFNCDINIVNKDGHTPCFVAELNSHTTCVNYLTIVETCINMSLELVKLNRMLRESKLENEALKIQMEETIGINNEFINQRENSVHISLDLMQNQINKLENKFLNEIYRLKKENEQLRGKLDETRNVDSENFKQDIENCKKELLSTCKNSMNFLSIDHKRIDNLKNQFEEIKLKNSLCTENDYNQDNKDHIDILRKMHQETTYKLMIFRNAIRKFNNSNHISNSTATMTSSCTSSSSSHYSSLFKPVYCKTINLDLENE